MSLGHLFVDTLQFDLANREMISQLVFGDDRKDLEKSLTGARLGAVVAIEWQ